MSDSENVLYVVVDPECGILGKSGSSTSGPAVYKTKRHAEKELDFRHNARYYRTYPNAEIVRFVPEVK